MPLCPTLCVSFLDYGEASTLSPLQEAQNSDLASGRRLEIMGDYLEGFIDSPCQQRA